MKRDPKMSALNIEHESDGKCRVVVMWRGGVTPPAPQLSTVQMFKETWQLSKLSIF